MTPLVVCHKTYRKSLFLHYPDRIYHICSAVAMPRQITAKMGPLPPDGGTTNIPEREISTALLEQ